jgi:hypothetical protein
VRLAQGGHKSQKHNGKNDLNAKSEIKMKLDFKSKKQVI